MKDHGKHNDKPIKELENDILGYHAYAENIAKMYANWSDKESSLVTALYGEWGSGKTSLKNLIINEIKEKGSKKGNFICRLFKRIFNKERCKQESIIIEFNPWEWASQDLIIDSFYNELIEQLNRQGRAAKKIAKILKKLQKKASFWNEFLEFLTSGKIKISAIGILLASVLDLSVDFVEKINLLNELLPLWLKVTSASVSVVIIFLNIVAHFFPTIKKTHQQLKIDLANILKKREAPLIIVLDDLDRLPLEQLKTVVQLVKVNMDFPNTVFMLLYQKDIVEKMLTNDYQDGAEYMKKIIQLPLNLPTDTTGKVSTLLSDALYPYLGESERNNTFAREIYNYIFIQFKTIRDVKRFLISFKFNFNALKRDSNHLFLDPLDFFILETLRIYDPKLFYIISTNRFYLTNNTWNSSDSDYLKILDVFKDAEQKKVNIKILDFLFTKESDSRDQSVVNRIYNEDVFEKYFSLMPYDLPSLSIKQINEATEDELMHLYRIWYDLKRDKDFIVYLYSNIDSLNKEKTNEYLIFLLKISDWIIQRDNTVVATEALLSSLFNKLLHKLEEAARARFFLENVDIQEDQYGFLLISYCLGFQAEGKGKYFKQEDFEKIKKKYCKKIILTLSKESSAFFNNQYLYTLLLHATRIYPEKIELIKAYIDQFIISDSDNVLIILEKFVLNYSTTGADFSGVRYYISQDKIEPFVSISVINDAIENLDQDLLNADERKLIVMYTENHKGFP